MANVPEDERPNAGPHHGPPPGAASVTGTPAPFFARFKTQRRAWLAVLSPPFLVIAIAWFVWASRQKLAPDLDLTLLDVSFLKKWAFGFGGLASLVGIWALIAVPRQPIFESPCPCCGARKVRDFSSAGEPPACGSCPAYLRAQGRVITEESAEALDMYAPRYRVPRARYEALPEVLVRGHASPYLRFEMPPICAICGAGHPKYTRPIHREGEARGQPSTGLLGEIASEAVMTAASDLGMGRRGGNYMDLKSKVRPDTQRYNERLKHLKAPVCKLHREDVYEPNHDAITDCHGALGFASYRYYKAFCELNQVYDAPPAGAVQIPRSSPTGTTKSTTP